MAATALGVLCRRSTSRALRCDPGCAGHAAAWRGASRVPPLHDRVDLALPPLRLIVAALSDLSVFCPRRRANQCRTTPADPRPPTDSIGMHWEESLLLPP